MTLLICGAVLCVAITALFTFQVLNFRSNFQRDATTLAIIIADNSAAALFFQDDAAATAVLLTLQAKSTVVTASLVLTNSSVFAHFGQAEEAKVLSQFPPAGECRFSGGDLLVSQPVKWKGERVSTLYLRLDYQRTFLALLGFYGLVVEASRSCRLFWRESFQAGWVARLQVPSSNWREPPKRSGRKRTTRCARL